MKIDRLRNTGVFRYLFSIFRYVTVARPQAKSNPKLSIDFLRYFDRYKIHKELPAMTLTKSQMIEAVSEANGFTKRKATETVETILEIIKGLLESGDDVLISGFGKFQVRQKAERRGRNPATGTDMILAPRKVVTFKCSGKLRDKINTAK
ncbi:MAG: integration host factor subunit alpha [Desulfobacterales bacterium]